jgi:hypothetical protein
MDQVPFQRDTPVVVSAVGNPRAAAATADIVDQDVDAAIGRDSGLDQPACLIGTADIGSVSRNFSAGRAQGRFRFAQLIRRARRQHYPAALGGKRFRGYQPDSAARTSNEGNLAGQFEIHEIGSLSAYSATRALRSAIQDFTWS